MLQLTVVFFMDCCKNDEWLREKDRKQRCDVTHFCLCLDSSYDRHRDKTQGLYKSTWQKQWSITLDICILKKYFQTVVYRL